ncbi:MAG: WD40/YVTN/BNR-like repeat-containing protein [Acidimicrobiia bacterium]
MTVLVAAHDGVVSFGPSGRSTALEGRQVSALARGAGHVWAIVDRAEVWRLDFGWAQSAVWSEPSLTCLGEGAGGLLVGTAGAHLLRLGDDGLAPVRAFEALPERDKWYTPWGAPPDTRSIADAGGRALVNVHVGGLATSDDDGRWRALAAVDIDVDVHQVVVAPDQSLLVATGAAGFGRSVDQGRQWAFDDDGLHGPYSRAVAVAGEHVLLTASAGPGRTDGAVYRRPLGAGGPWARTTDFVPGNVDTHCLAADGDKAAFVTEAGVLWASTDGGATWAIEADGLGHPSAVTIV